MQMHTGASLSSMEEEKDEQSLFSRGTNAFQSVFGQVGKQSVPAEEEARVESIPKSSQLAENTNVAVIGKKLDQKLRRSPKCGKAGRANSKENLWNRASLVKAALSKSTAKGVQSKQNAIQKGGTSPRESSQKGSLREGRVVWRSAEPRNRGAEAVSMRRLSKRELELKRLELRPLLNALKFVESSDRVNVPDGDDGTSIGPFQISMDYHQDVWQQKHLWEKARNVDHAEETVIQYWSIYCPKALETHDFETLAKVHNGGPRGPAVSKTTYYWSKVLRHLKQQQELRIPQDAQHLSPRRAHGGRTKWKDAPRKAGRSGGEEKSPILLPSKAPPAKTKSHLPKGHRHVHHARLVHIRPHHGGYRAHVAKEKRGTKGKAGPPEASPPKKGKVIHTRHSSFSSTTTYGHYTQASSIAATFPPQEGSFSLTDLQTPQPLKPSSRNFKTPSPLSSPDEDLTIKPGDSIIQWQSPTDSPEPSLAPDSPGTGSHSSGGFKLRRVRTHSREDLAVLSETPEALVAEMVRKRGGMKLGFRVSPRARLSPSRRMRHPFRSSAGFEAEALDVGRPVRCVRLEISTEELQQALEAEISARQKSAGAFQYREQDQGSDDESDSSGLSDHEVPSPISSAGSLTPDKAFTLAFLQTAIRRSQKKMAAVMIQRAYQKYRPRREFVKLRATTIRMQQLVRAWQSGRPHRERFLALRGAALKLQTLWWAKHERRSMLLQAVQDRIRFLTMRKAAVEIQRVWRGHFARTVLWALFVDTSEGGKFTDGKEGALAVDNSSGFVVENGGAKRALLVDVSDGAVESEAEDEVESPGWTWKITGVRVELSPKLRLGRKGEKVDGGLQSEDGVAEVELPAGAETQLAFAPRTLGFGGGDRSPAAESRWMTASVIQSFEVGSPERGVYSTPPLSPRREEELYRQLAELQAHDGRDHVQSASVHPVAGCCWVEDLSANSSAESEPVEQDAALNFEAEATPPLSPSREEALFAQLADLLPSIESLSLGTANLERAEETSLHAQYASREAGTGSESCAVSGPATGDVSRERVVEAARWAAEQREERAESDRNAQMGAAVELQNAESENFLSDVRAEVVGEKKVEVAGGTVGRSDASVEFGQKGAAPVSGEVQSAESRNGGAAIEDFDGEQVVEAARGAAEESEGQAESVGNGQMSAGSLSLDARSAESGSLASQIRAAGEDLPGERLVRVAAERGEESEESEGEGQMGLGAEAQCLASGAEAVAEDVDGERVFGAARWAAEKSWESFACEREGHWGQASLGGELPSAAVLEIEGVSTPPGTPTPVSGSEGLLTPRRESQLLLQLAELIAQHAPANADRNGEADELPVEVESTASPEASLGGVTKEGMIGSFEVGEERKNREDARESGHVSEERSDNCLALKPSEDLKSELVDDLWALRKGGLFVSKDEKVASWDARKPLDMVVPREAGLTAGKAAGDSCSGNEGRCQMEADEAASWPLRKALNEVAPCEAGLTGGMAEGDNDTTNEVQCWIEAVEVVSLKPLDVVAPCGVWLDGGQAARDGSSENVDRCQAEAVEFASWHDQKPLDAVAPYEVGLVVGTAASDSTSDSGDRGWPESLEVASWHEKEPLEMLAPCKVGVAAGDSCSEGGERCRTGAMKEVEAGECAEAVDVGSGEERRWEVAEIVPGAEMEGEMHEEAMREKGPCLDGGPVALQAASSDVSTVVEEVKAASVREDSAPESEHDLCSPEHCAGSDAAWAPPVIFGGTPDSEPQACSPEHFDASAPLSQGGEFGARVFVHQEDPSSGDCSPSPTESDASVFALQNRTPISSPALMLAKAALLDSARKVAFWNDAAANLPLSEQNLQVSIAPPGDSTWEGDAESLGRAGGSPDWHDTGSGFPDDSWTNSPSHRSFSVRESLDRDSSLGEVKVSDCLSPDKSLGLVRAEVEKLNSMEKGRFTLGRGASGQWGVNEGKLLDMEWAHVRLGLGLLKQWILENGSADQKPQNPGNLMETESPAKPQIREKAQAPLGGSFTQLCEASKTAAHSMDPLPTPRTLAKSKSEPALSGPDELPDGNPHPNHQGFLPEPPQESGSFLHLLTKRTVARKLSLPLAPAVSSPPGNPLSPPPEGGPDFANSALLSQTGNSPASKAEGLAPTLNPSTSGAHPKPTASNPERNPSLTCPDPSLRVDLPLDPELSDSPVVSPAEPKSPKKGVTFDSFGHTHNNGSQTSPTRRKSYAHSPHGRDGKECLVCRLWEEGSFVGLRDSPRPRTLRYRTNSLSRSWSSHEMPPLGQGPATSSPTARNSFHSGSCETTSSPSIGRSSSISIPAGPRPYRGSPNLPLDRSSAGSEVQSSPSEGSSVPSSMPVTSRSSRGSLESTSTDRGSVEWSSSPSLSPSTSSSYGSSRKGVLLGSKLPPKTSGQPQLDRHSFRNHGLDGQLSQSPPISKPQTPKPPSPRPPRPAPGPAHLLPPTGHRNISADVITALVGRSPKQVAPRPRLGLWKRGSKGGRMKNPIGLFPSTMKAAVGKSLEAPAVLLERTSNPQVGKVDDASGRKKFARPSYNRSSQDARLVKASAGLSEEAIRERDLRSGESKANESLAVERSAGRFSPARSEKRAQRSEIGTIGSPIVTPPKGNQSKFTPNDSSDELSVALASLSIEDRRLLGGRWSDESAEVSGQAEGLEGVRELEMEFDAVSPQAEGLPFRGEVGSGEAPGARPEAPVALMPTLVKLCQLWEERHVDFRVRAEKYQRVIQELTSLGDEVRMVYYVSPTWGPPGVMKALDEVEAIERSAQEEEQAAELVLRQRDCIHAGLSYQLSQVERLQLYAAWGVRRWSTGRLRRIVYKQLWLDPERCDQSAAWTMQFLEGAKPRQWRPNHCLDSIVLTSIVP